ncbi:hypothetical protein KI387_000034, partial [Taxus chinensis]
MQGTGRNSRELSSFSDSFGLGNRGSLFSSIFDRDPFNDPFFTRPFGSSFGSFFGSDGFFGEQSVFTQDYQPQWQSGQRGPVIEELRDEHEDASGPKPKTSQVPIVEDPDDDENQEHKVQRQSRRSSVYQENNHSYGSQGPPQTYRFQSSSVTYGGINGAYYTSSTTRRAGTNGVIEEEHREADTTTGKATQRISRGIRDKGHSFTKKLSSDGKVDSMETLHNLGKDEVAQFHEDWERKAENSLPGWKKSHASMLDE